VCGKHLDDDGYVLQTHLILLSPHLIFSCRRAYCSDDCQYIDTSSPCISSASSAFSSPHLPCAVGGEVPALVPSVLGPALKSLHGRDRCSISSSSASSTSWSVVTDDEDNTILHSLDDDYSYDLLDSMYAGTSKSANFTHSMRPFGLSYARRPSGTNNHATVPLLHRRTSSTSSFAAHAHEAPHPSSIHSHFSSAEEDEDDNSDFGFSSRDDRERFHLPIALKEHERSSTVTAKVKRSRNRASLPAYFSLLQTGSGSSQRSASGASTLGTTATRPSPPTPKLTFAGLAATLPHSNSLTSTLQSTPRGRRKEFDVPRASRRSEHSRSRSHSRHLARVAPLSRARHDSKSSAEKVLDWSTSVPLERGRAPVRRNSSPPPKMVLTQKPGAIAVSPVLARTTRGRARVEELDGRAWTAQAPGFGHGRSGLLNRKAAAGRGMLGLR
jgi:hypothetical protein